MRAFVFLDGVWVALLLAFGGFAYYEGAERGQLKDDAETIRKELAQIEKAIGRAAVQQSLPAPGSVPFEVYSKYLESGSSRLREGGFDPLGNAYGAQPTSGHPTVPEASVERLRHVVDPKFWAPYRIAKP